MKEFIEKLISRFEEYIETAKAEGDFTYIKPFEMAKNAVNQLAEEYNNGWIPCSERLPENDTIVLISIFSELEDKMLVECVRYYREEWEQPDYGEWAYTTDQILAWQPLPPKYEPKGVKHEKMV